MPTIKRTIKQIIRIDVEANASHVCCDGLRKSFKSDGSNSAAVRNGGLMMGGGPIDFCPFCGEKVIYDDTVILPEGYRKG